MASWKFYTELHKLPENLAADESETKRDRQTTAVEREEEATEAREPSVWKQTLLAEDHRSRGIAPHQTVSEKPSFCMFHIVNCQPPNSKFL